MRLALASCRDLPAWEIDDRALHAALDARGIDHEVLPWDDEAADWSSFDACLIRTTWDYVARIDAFRDWVVRAAGATRLLNPADLVLWNLDKRYLRELESRGVPTVPTVWLEPGARIDLGALLAERGWKRGMIKPVVGASASGTLPFHDTPEELRRAAGHLDALLSRQAAMVQPFLGSVLEEGEYSVIFVEGVAAHAVRKVPKAGDYRVQDDYGAHDEPAKVSGELAASARAAVAALDEAPLYARADLVRADDGGMRLIELELVEPSLFFRHGPGTAARLADALLRRLKASS